MNDAYKNIVEVAKASFVKADSCILEILLTVKIHVYRYFMQNDQQQL